MNLASLLLNARSDRDAISYTVRKPNLRVRSIGKDLVTVSDKNIIEDAYCGGEHYTIVSTTGFRQQPGSRTGSLIPSQRHR